MSNFSLQVNKKRRDIPIKISVIYAFFSTCWIVFSDRILLIMIDDVNIMTVVQTLKGWFFILITTFLIYNLLKREIQKVRRLEDLVIQSEKMMSISNLALGMANQINNPLAGIVQSTQVVRNRLLKNQKKNVEIADSYGISFERLKDYVENREISRILDSIMESSYKATEIIDNMVSFTSGDSTERKVSKNVKDLIENTVELLLKDQNFTNANIVREYRDNPELLCEPSKLQHVFFCILKNAFENKRDKTIAPNVVISLKSTEKMVKIAIEDSGPGISDKIKSKIFEPFFTTRAGARGMGLAVSYYTISEIHHGFIKVESREGKGAKFIIHLPVF